MGGYISAIWGWDSPAEPTDSPQEEEKFSSIKPEDQRPVHPQIPPETPRQPADPNERRSVFPQRTLSTSDHTDTEEAENINIYVLYAGKSHEILIYPLERVSVLLQEACEKFQKKQESMKLIFDGEELDVTKTVKDYPKLRGGKKVNLIGSS